MTRTEFVVAIARTTGITRSEASRLLDAIQSIIAATLAAGEPVKLLRFGRFEVIELKPTRRPNPQTGGTVPVGPRKAVRFRAAPHLARRIAR